MNRAPILIAVLIALLPVSIGANLAYSTYLKDNFTPAGLAADAQGSIYMVGSTNPFTQQTTVAKVDSQGSRYIYFADLGLGTKSVASAIAVDSAGNAYIGGYTYDPNFPVTGSQFATPPDGTGTDHRSFVVKLNPEGAVVFSVLLGGSTSNDARAIALTAHGQILVSGYSFARGFPTTPGAYSIPDSTHRWFLTEIDAAASRTIFSATGIGGSSIVVDAAGSIYLAGFSYADYPTTPGAYQSTISQFFFCGGFLCQVGSVEWGLHVTKTDSAASNLIYSTGIPLIGVDGLGNNGQHILAVDSAGDAYVSRSPTLLPTYANTLTKLDPAGSSALFSVTTGGGGVQIDSSGALYANGFVLGTNHIAEVNGPLTPAAPPAAFSWVPQACWPNNVVATAEVYVVKLDPATGTVEDTQWFDGSSPTVTDMIVAGGKLWIAGQTPAPDVPYTPGAGLAPASVSPGMLPGGFLAAADFSQSGPGPVIACVMDQGNMTHVGAVAPGQLISLFGENQDGAAVTFDGIPAPLLYVSASQVNVAVPAVAGATTVMQVTVNGVSIVRQFPVTASNLNMFVDLSKETVCGNPSSGYGFQLLASNADGTLNSCANPAKNGSIVSFYAHGAGAALSTQAIQVEFQHPCTNATDQPQVEQAGPINSYVDRVDVRLGLSFSNCGANFNQVLPELLTVSYGGKLAGPFSLPGSISITYQKQQIPLIVWVTPGS